MLDHQVKRRLKALGYAVVSDEYGYYTTHHGQLLESGGINRENHPGFRVREAAENHRTYDNLAWDAALIHSKTYYLVLTSRRLGTHFDVYRGGMMLPIRVKLSYAQAIAFTKRETRQGRCVQVVTEQRNGTLHMEVTEA